MISFQVMGMSVSKLYRTLLGNLAITPVLAVLLLTACGGEEKPDLGPRRTPRDNDALAHPAPPPQVNPLIPGYDIPAPRSRTPMMIDQVPENHSSSMMPPVQPSQNGMIYAPQGTVSMGGMPSSVRPMPVASAQPNGRRAPAKQFAGPPPVLPSVAQAPVKAPQSAAVPAQPPVWQPPQPAFQQVPGKPMKYEPTMVRNSAPAPYAEPATTQTGSFWDKITGIFSNGQQASQSSQAATTSSNLNKKPRVAESVVVEKPVPIPSIPPTRAEEAAQLENELQILDEQDFSETENLPPEPESLPLRQPSQVKPVVVPLKRDDNAAKTGVVALPQKAPVISSQPEVQPVVKRSFNKKTMPLEVQPAPPSDQGKSIIDLIEERRQYYGYSPSSHALPEPEVKEKIKPSPVSVEQKPLPAPKKPVVKGKSLNDDVRPWLDRKQQSGIDTSVNVGAKAVAAPPSDAEVLVEFEIDDTGNMVGVSGGAKGKPKTAAP